MLIEARACEVVAQLSLYAQRKQRLLQPDDPQDAELMALATAQLQQLSNESLEELLLDTYDEVHRRNTAETWDAFSQAADMPPDCVLVPFLPVTPGLPPVRLQVSACVRAHSLGNQTLDTVVAQTRGLSHSHFSKPPNSHGRSWRSFQSRGSSPLLTRSFAMLRGANRRGQRGTLPPTSPRRTRSQTRPRPRRRTRARLQLAAMPQPAVPTTYGCPVSPPPLVLFSRLLRVAARVQPPLPSLRWGPRRLPLPPYHPCSP